MAVPDRHKAVFGMDLQCQALIGADLHTAAHGDDRRRLRCPAVVRAGFCQGQFFLDLTGKRHG